MAGQKDKSSAKPAKTAARVPKKLILLWMMVFIAFLGEALFYTWCRMQCVQVGYAISKETHRQQDYQNLNNSLKIELAHLKTPENISRMARQKLSLGMPDPKQFIVLP